MLCILILTMNLLTYSQGTLATAALGSFSFWFTPPPHPTISRDILDDFPRHWPYILWPKLFNLPISISSWITNRWRKIWWRLLHIYANMSVQRRSASIRIWVASRRFGFRNVRRCCIEVFLDTSEKGFGCWELSYRNLTKIIGGRG